LKIGNNTTNVIKASKTIAITTTKTKPDTNNKAKAKQIMPSNSGWLLDRKIDDATSGLRREFSRDLYSISEENALTIANYILAMRVEINLSDSYRLNVISILCKFSKCQANKQFDAIDREDILAFLDSLRKPDISDPLHKWIGTYNLYRTYLLRFYKWLYHADVEPNKT